MSCTGRVAAVLVVLTIGCATSPTTKQGRTEAQHPAEWTEARGALEALRSTWGAQDGTTPVVARFSGADAADGIDGRGALAVRRPDAIRLIVVAAGGPTAFDLWIRGDRFRMAMPMRDRIVRGGRGDKGANLPISFLRWWLLTPLRGKLVAAYTDGVSRRWVLQDDGATYDVRRTESDALTIIRRGEGATEQLQVEHPGCPRAEYRNEQLGLQVVIACDPNGERGAAASDRAFEDPDATRP